MELMEWVCQDESRRVVKGWVLDRLSQESLEWAVGTAEET